MMPLARMDCASSSSRSDWKTWRGCNGFGPIASMDNQTTPSFEGGGSVVGCGVGLVGRRALRPLPRALRGFSTFLFMLQNFLGEADIAFGAAGTNVVSQNSLAVTRGLG